MEMSGHYYRCKKKVKENDPLVKLAKESLHKDVEKANLSMVEAKEIAKIELLNGIVNAQITSTEFIIALGTILEI